MIFSFYYSWCREEGRIQQKNHVMDTMGVMSLYKFALDLFGLQIDFIGSLQRIDYCGPSIGCMQPLVFKKSWRGG